MISHLFSLYLIDVDSIVIRPATNLISCVLHLTDVSGVIHKLVRLMINVRKIYGLSREPCGMPPLSFSQSKNALPRLNSLLSIRQEWRAPTANKFRDSQLSQLLQHNYVVDVIKRFCEIYKQGSNWLHFYSMPQCSHCKRCTSYSNSISPFVRLSVHPSLTRRYCVKTTARSMVQFALSDSKMCLVF